MIKNKMSGKERWIASIKMEEVDRLVFWPKILNDSYTAEQKTPFNNMELKELYSWIGSDQHGWLANALQINGENVEKTVKETKSVRTTSYTAFNKTLELVEHYDARSFSWHPVKFPINTLDDIRVMTDYYENVKVDIDKEALNEAKKNYKIIGDDSIAASVIGESPLMHFVEWFAGVENAHLLLFDYEQEVENLFDAMHNYLLECTKLIVESTPADIIYFIENTSTTLISPDQYRKYCLPYITEYGELIKKADQLLVLHMCGHLKALLPDLNKLPADAFEAFTSPTLGNTTLLDGRSSCNNKCLIGGTNASLWMQSADEIISQIEHDLNELPHHRGIIVTPAGIMTPLCPPEIIKKVSGWVKSYRPVF